MMRAALAPSALILRQFSCTSGAQLRASGVLGDIAILDQRLPPYRATQNTSSEEDES
jgi:hypothetical protein